MAVRLTAIHPKSSSAPTDKVAGHMAIESFRWIDESDKKTGVSSRTVMFDWITNRKGVAYVTVGGETIFVFGAVSPSGVQYIRALKDGKWTDDILDLPSFDG